MLTPVKPLSSPLTLVRLLAVVAALFFVGAGGAVARADEGAGPVKVDDGQHGLVVLGMGSTVDAAWPLARALYADASLRPGALDEAHARVLVGEAPGDAAAAELRDLADTRAAVHGDDAASRRLLQFIALSLHVKGIVVVEPASAPNARPAARVFVTTPGTYDAVRYEPDPSAPVTWGSGASAVRWSGAVLALRRGFGDAAPAAQPQPAAQAAPGTPPPSTSPDSAVSVIALRPVPSAPARPVDSGKSGSRAFYQSPWFWAAAGAALFAAGAVYLATRNDGSDNIQLQVQVPR